MDIQFFDESGEIIKKNFEIPSKIDMEDNYWPKDETYYDDNLKEEVSTKYELFATICFDAKNLDNMSYYPLVKKRHKLTKKP